MAKVFWRGKWAWADFYRDGKRIREPLRTKDPAVADLRLAQKIREYDNRQGLAGGEYTVAEAAEKFIDEHFPNLKPKSIRRYRASLRLLLPHFGHMKLADISSKDLSAYETARRKMISPKTGKRVSHVTIKRDFACLSSIFSSAQAWEWVKYNPVLPYIRERAKKGVMVENEERTRYLDHEEERLAIANMPDTPGNEGTIREAVIVSIEQGLRAEELWSLLKSDINRARQRLTVRKEISKTGKTRTIPITPRAWEIIERRLMNNVSDHIFWRWRRDPETGEEYTEKVEHTWAYREFQKGIEAAGLEDVQWHDLRRTCGCRLLQDKGFSMLQVSKWLGHSSVKVTEKRYAFLFVDDLEKALKRGNEK